MTDQISSTTNAGTGQLIVALLKKARWYDYVITIVWLGLVAYTWTWYAQFSAMGFTEDLAAAYGLGFFALTLAAWPVIRAVVYFAHRRMRSH